MVPPDDRSAAREDEGPPESLLARERHVAHRVLGGVVGLLAGLVAGLAVSLAFVVARAALEEVYLHGVDELVGWPGVPLALLPLAGVGLGLAGRLARPAAGAALGGLIGTAVGTLVGAAVSSEPAGPWAGAIVGAGAGLLLGAALTPARWMARLGLRRHHLPSSRRLAVVAVVAVVGAGVAATTCNGEPPPLPPAGAVPPPDTSAVASVVLFVGDAGEGTLRTHPVLVRLRRDVERWSAALGPEGEVVVVYLGDIVYPAGLSAPDAPGWADDSTHLAAQVALVAGPEARSAGTRGIFVVGNHDWGQEEDWEGAVRVVRLGQFLERRRAEGVRVALEPAAGTGGPSVLDVGAHLRLVFLDTAWWLLDAERVSKDRVIAGVEEALAGAGGRSVVMAAHHPFVSSGPHGGLVRVGETLGLRTLLSRSGALLQDLYSAPYRELRGDLLDVFRRTGAPVLFAGGHEHSLQVVRTREPGAPRTSLVSGSASKLTGVGPLPGTLFARSAPGYATLLVLHGGELRLRMEATPRPYLECPEDEPGSATAARAPAWNDGAPRGMAVDPSGIAAAPRDGCLARGVAAFRTVWAGPI